MSAEDPTSYLQYAWFVLSAPIAFLYRKLYSMRAELSQVKTTQQYKKADLEELKQDIKNMSSKVDTLCGRIDEHLRK